MEHKLRIDLQVAWFFQMLNSCAASLRLSDFKFFLAQRVRARFCQTNMQAVCTKHLPPPSHQEHQELEVLA